MRFSVRQFASLIVGSAVTVGAWAPSAHAQRGRTMTGAMQSFRFTGTMNTTSTTRRSFTGGFGLNAYRGLYGLGGNYPNRYLAAAAGQSGYGGAGSSYGGGGGGYGGGGGGGGGGQPQGGSAPPPSYGAAYDPNAAAREAKSSEESARTSQLRSLRLSAGGLDWPRALHYLTSDGSLRELREDIDAQVERVLARSSAKTVSSEQLANLKGDVDKLRRRFVAQSYDLPMTSQQEADSRRFLRHVASALEQVSATATLSAKR